MEGLNEFNPFFDFEQFFTFREVKVAEYLTNLTLRFKLRRIKGLFFFFFFFNEFCLAFHNSPKLRYFLRMKVVKLFFIKERYDKFKANF